jgi:toxin ParE1/3/4
MTYRFHLEASAEYEESIRFYRQARPGLQKRFVASVEEAIGRILEHPERWRMIEPDIRRCLVKVFPFSVVYSVQGDTIFIIAVAHTRREPGYWKERVKK